MPPIDDEDRTSMLPAMADDEAESIESLPSDLLDAVDDEDELDTALMQEDALAAIRQGRFDPTAWKAGAAVPDKIETLDGGDFLIEASGDDDATERSVDAPADIKLPPVARHAADKNEETSLGALNELSSSILRRAEMLDNERAPRPAAADPANEPGGIDSYLARVIGKPADKSTAPQIPALRHPSGQQNRRVDLALDETLDRVDAPAAQAPVPMAASPGAVPVVHRQPGLEQPANAQARSPQPVAAPAQPQTPPSPAAEPAVPGVVVDKGYEDDKPTLMQTSLEDEIRKAKAHAAAQAARAARHVPMRASAESAWRPDASPDDLPWRHIGGRAAIFAAVFYALFWLLWLPFMWESSLARRMEQRLDESHTQWTSGDYAEARDALDGYDEVARMQGARLGVVESFMSGYIESLFGRQRIAALRSQAAQSGAATRAWLAARFDAGLRGDANAAITDVAEVDSPLVAAARGWLDLDAQGASQVADTLRPYRRANLPSLQLYLLIAEIETRRGRPVAARNAARRALRLAPDRPVARLAMARANELDQLDVARSLYEPLASSGNASAQVALALLDGEQGNDPTPRLQALLDADTAPRTRATIHAELARLALRAGRPDEAETQVRTGLSLEPGSGELHALLIGMHLDRRQMAPARAALDTALKAAGDHPDVQTRRAEMLFAEGNVASAVGLLTELAEQHWQAGQQLAAISLEMMDPDAARAQLDAAAALAPPGTARDGLETLRDLLADELSVRDAAYGRMQFRMPSLSQRERLTLAWALLQHEEQRATARDIFDTLLAAEPTHPVALAGRCASWAVDAPSDEATTRCGEAVALAGTYPPARQAAAMSALTGERYGDALEGFQAVTAAWPNRVSMRGGLESALLGWKLDTAAELLDAWLARYGASAEHDYWSGRLALLQGQIARARELLGRAVGSPRAPAAWAPFHAEALYESGSLGRARDALIGFRDARGARVGADYVLSLVALSERRADDALEHAQRALEHAQSDRAPRWQRSRALVALARAESSRNAATKVVRGHLEAAIEANPRNIDAHYQLGLLARRDGNKDEARRAFQRALDLYPSHAPSLSAMAALK